jgi:hypothetical protein
VELIQWTARRFPDLSRTELASTVCENLPWRAPNGRLRSRECLDLLEQLGAGGVVELPAKRVRKAPGPRHLRAQPLPGVDLAAGLRDIQPVTVEPVPPGERAVWDATVAAHHALGFRRAFGAHQRYWVAARLGGQRVILGGLLFAAPAKSVAARDAALGWTRQEQQRYRYRVVANSRFVLLRGVRVPHLASHVLALAVRRLRADWQQRFGYEPVVVETYVSPPWRGTCYRAANWMHVGQTTGRGRQDRRYGQAGTVREVFLYPLVPNWRPALVAPAAERPTEDEPPGAPVAATGGASMITAEQRLNELTAERIRRRFTAVAPFLDEKQRRLLAGAEAMTYGTGGVEQVAALVGLAKQTVERGLHEIQHPEEIEPERVRRKGGGRKPATATDPELLSDLERLVAPGTRGDPESPLRWTSKSTRHLAAELSAMKPGRTVSHVLVGELLHGMGYSLQATRKMREGTDHPDRDAQFRHINATAQDYQQRGQPVISIDSKKKELVGDFKNAGREWQPEKHPEAVRIHDFMLPDLGKITPYGVYDTARNEAWVSVGTDHDTASFAVASIRAWWENMGRQAYPEATSLLITADGGGSNSPRVRLWKTQLQQLADDTGLQIGVCHFPPGTSKWNKIEHRLFAHITQNWRGRPLVSHETIVNLIANTTTATGLTVRCALDTASYPTGVAVSDHDIKTLQIKGSESHPEWNYVVHPRTSEKSY